MAAVGTTTWSDKETLQLIEFWGDQSIQAMLEGCTRNIHVYDKLARELERAGYKRSWSQCRDKLKKLKGDYRKVKDHNNETGRERKVWKYFEEMDAILQLQLITIGSLTLFVGSYTVFTLTWHGAAQRNTIQHSPRFSSNCNYNYKHGGVFFAGYKISFSS